MNVVDIHKMLKQVWPDGIHPDAYPLLAGVMVAGRNPVDSSVMSLVMAMHQGLSHGVAAKRPYFKLNAKLAKKIRAKLAVGATQSALAKEYGASRSLICQVAAGKIWKPEQPKPETQAAKPSPRSAPSKHVNAIYTHLAIRKPLYSVTQGDLARNLHLGPWTVKRALWQLVREGKVLRLTSVQGPHRYKAA